jgi:hypothetical protein
MRDGVASPLNPWPPTSGGGIVLDADEEGGSKVEEELLGDSGICKLWDAVAAADE